MKRCIKTYEFVLFQITRTLNLRLKSAPYWSLVRPKVREVSTQTYEHINTHFSPRFNSNLRKTIETDRAQPVRNENSTMWRTSTASSGKDFSSGPLGTPFRPPCTFIVRREKTEQKKPVNVKKKRKNAGFQLTFMVRLALDFNSLLRSAVDRRVDGASWSRVRQNDPSRWLCRRRRRRQSFLRVFSCLYFFLSPLVGASVPRVSVGDGEWCGCRARPTVIYTPGPAGRRALCNATVAPPNRAPKTRAGDRQRVRERWWRPTLSSAYIVSSENARSHAGSTRAPVTANVSRAKICCETNT